MSNLTRVELNEEGKEITGFLLDIKGNIPDLRKSINLRSPGFIVNDDMIEKWFFKGYITGDKTYIYGNNFQGKPLKEILSLPVNESLPFIYKMIEAVDLLQIEEGVIAKLQLDTVFFLDDGGILFLPFDVISEIMDNAKDDYKSENYCVINNPYIKEKEIWLSYSVALVLYKTLTGSYPFTGDSEDEINNKFRNGKAVEPRMLNFELKQDVSSCLAKFINKDDARHKPELWKEIVKRWIDEGVTEEVSSQQNETLKIRSEKEMIKCEKIFKRKYFFERNRARLTTSVIILIALSVVLYYVISIATKPKSTKGFTPEQVVETFYGCFNKLDELTLSDCVAKGVAEDDKNEITYLFLSDKQTMAYEMKSYFIPADQWVKEGKKTVAVPYVVFGINNLSIKQEKSDIDPIFLATYEKYRTNYESGDTENREINGALIKEKLYLNEQGKYWVIYKIERLQETKIQ